MSSGPALKISASVAGLGDRYESQPSPDVPPFASVPRAAGENSSPAARTRSRTGPSTETNPMAATRDTSGVDAARDAGTPSGSTQQRKRRSSPVGRASKRARPTPSKKNSLESEFELGEEEDKKPAAAQSCCICMCDVQPDDLAGISGCGHKFCFDCIEKWAERENSCPLCKVRFTKIDRVNKKKKRGHKNTKRVRQRSQRTDLLPGMDALIASFASRHSATNSRLLFATAGIAFAGVRGGMGFMHPLMGDSDDDDDQEPTSLFSALLRAPVPVRTSIRPHSLRTVSHSVTSTPNRSYASNAFDRSAGAASNPLTILDDSDGEDDVVEVL